MHAVSKKILLPCFLLLAGIASAADHSMFITEPLNSGPK